MPSWLSPRVGTVPQDGLPDNKKKDRRSKAKPAPKKGITMEDLKKQTALRLAQEQKKRPPEIMMMKGPSVAIHPALPPAATMNPMYPPPPPLPPQVPPMPYQYEMPPSGMAGMAHNPPPPPPPSYGRPTSVVDAAPLRPSQTYTTATPTLTPVVKASVTDQQVEATKDANNSKLPHGLTVQELKEMTKARLQAEAAKKDQSPLTVMERRDQPPPLSVSTHSLRAPVPFVQSRSRTHSRDGWSQCSRGGGGGGDADDYSVCSITSDFPGSESAFGTGPSPSPSPFVPNRAHLGSFGSVATMVEPVDTFTVSPLPGAVGHSGTIAPTFASSGDLYSPNRRCAQTLSPRQGFSHLDEDRQVLPGQEFPGMPSFSTPPSNRHYPRYSNGTSAELFTGLLSRPDAVDAASRAHTFSVGPTSISDRTLNSSDWIENRPRTSSAASLPAISHTAEEFFLMDSQQQYQRSSFHRLSSGIGVLDEEDVQGPAVTGLADVFRKSPPPGFGSTTGRRGESTATSLSARKGGLGGGVMGGNAGDVRNRASTWAPDSMFGSLTSPPSTSLGMEELAAILQLSEAEASSSR